jgi:SSS family solute:Na+ symporter
MLAQAVGVKEIIVVLVYLLVVVYLGFLGWKQTKSATDYLIAGRGVHPFVMAMSYGATFISTSAIVGFGGVAGMFGMSLLWLTFLNIFVGIFIAFVFLGGPTRRMGHHLDAHTFPELLARRFESKFLQVFSGLVIFLFIPLYAAAVLIGGCAFIASQFGISYEVALLVFSVIIAAYVVMGGLKGVMYSDALQGTIMFAGMLVLLIWTYKMLGGVTAAHEALTEAGKGPSLFGGIGFKGWTAMPEFGWGATESAKGPNPAAYNLWWIVISTITLGVGIGVLAQPQLAVRFMTVKSKKELNRAVLVGGVFILVMTGVSFTVGSLSNVFLLQKEVVKGKLMSVTGVGKTPAEFSWVIAKKARGINVKPDGSLKNPAIGADEKSLPCVLLHIDTVGDDQADTHLIYKGYGGAAAITPAAVIEGLEVGADPTPLVGQNIEVQPKATAYLRAIVKYMTKAADGSDRVVYECQTSKIIPAYIRGAMPGWFGLIFLVTLLAAAMSTLSSQFHAVGTSIGRDVYEQITGRHNRSIGATRIGIIVGIIVAVLFSYYMRSGYIIARATAIFFGLCGAAFLPAFIGGLFFKRMTKSAAVSSVLIGFLVSMFWLVFIKDKEARALGICYSLFEKHSLLLDKPNWSVVDPIVIALPVSIIVAIVVSLMTKPPSQEHLDKCFNK